MLKLDKVIIKMSDNGFYLFPTNKIYKKENTKRLTHFPAGYNGKSEALMTMLIVF